MRIDILIKPTMEHTFQSIIDSKEMSVPPDFTTQEEDPVLKRLLEHPEIVSISVEYVLTFKVIPENRVKVQNRYASLPYAFRVTYPGEPRYEIVSNRRCRAFNRKLLNNPPEEIIQVQKDPEVLGVEIENMLYLGVAEKDRERLMAEFTAFVPYRFRVKSENPAVLC